MGLGNHLAARAGACTRRGDAEAGYGDQIEVIHDAKAGTFGGTVFVQSPLKDMLPVGDILSGRRQGEGVSARSALAGARGARPHSAPIVAEHGPA